VAVAKAINNQGQQLTRGQILLQRLCAGNLFGGRDGTATPPLAEGEDGFDLYDSDLDNEPGEDDDSGAEDSVSWKLFFYRYCRLIPLFHTEIVSYPSFSHQYIVGYPIFSHNPTFSHQYVVGHPIFSHVYHFFTPIWLVIPPFHT